MELKKSIIRIIFVTFSMLVSGYANSQKPLPRIVTSEEFIGKDSDKIVYDVETDSKGYLYMTTNQGICYFNGFKLEFQKIQYEKNIRQHYYVIHKDYDGELWFGSQYGISYLEKDSLLSYPVPDSILKLGRIMFEEVYQDRDGLLHLAPRYQGYYTVDSQGEVTEMMAKKDSNINGFVITKLDDGSWFHFSVLSNTESKISIYFLNNDGELEKITDTEDIRPGHESSLVQHADGSFSLSIGTNTLIRFRENELIDIRVLDVEIIKLFVDSRNDLWIGTLKNGVIQAKNSNLSDLSYYDKGSSTAIVTESFDGGLWCKSTSMGFGYIAPHSFLHYSEQNGYDEIKAVSTVEVVSDRILFSTSENEWFFLMGDTLEKVPFILGEHKIGSVRTAYDEQNKTFWIASEGSIYKVLNDKIEFLDINDSVFKSSHMRHLKNIDGRILGITKKDFFEVKSDTIIKISDSKNHNFRDFTIDHEGSFWFIVDQGIGILKDGLITALPYDIPAELNKDYMSIFYAQESVWVLNLDGSLLKFNNDSCWQVMNQNSEAVDFINYSIDAHDAIWGLDHKGNLNRIKNSSALKHVTLEKFKITKQCAAFLSRFGLSVLDETIYMGSRYGLFKQKIEDLKTETTPSKVNFEIAINNEKVDFDTLYTLDYSKNDIRIEYDAINFERKSLIYSYKLEGYDTTWFDTKFKQRNYTNLSPGIYRFKLRTKTYRGELTQADIITFKIAKPYWQTWWFIIGITLSVLLLIILFIRFRIQQVRNREKEKSKIALELARLEMRALKAQINPHFIFNSITSAILHLYKKDYDKTAFYLEGFAKLLRKVLENSDHSLVKLAEEMELMDQYVQIESGHFEGEPISFDIIYNEIDPRKINIQPTLLQPYIENSIHHGLKGKLGKRIIRVIFFLNKEELEVQIEDNGIGRKAAKANGFYKDYKSYGMFISARRIELLNKAAFSGVSIDDLENEKGEAMGTRIRFKIPVSQ